MQFRRRPRPPPSVTSSPAPAAACQCPGRSFPRRSPLLVLPSLRPRARLLRRMDLVGVSSPEPGPAAAWGPRKVSGGRGWHSCRAHAGCWSRTAAEAARQAWAGAPRASRRPPGGPGGDWVCARSVRRLDRSGTPRTGSCSPAKRQPYPRRLRQKTALGRCCLQTTAVISVR